MSLNLYRHDKLVHWFTCIAIGVLTLIVTTWTHEPSLALAVINIVIAGFGKEFYDKHIKKTFFDWWDIAADMAAIPIVVAIYLILF